MLWSTTAIPFCRKFKHAFIYTAQCPFNAYLRAAGSGNERSKKVPVF